MATDKRDNEIAQRIMRSAVRLFAKKGYEATSTREIVEDAGVTKPTLYYYFESKEGLCQAVLRSHVEELHERLRRVLAGGAEGRALLVDFVWTHLDYWQGSTDFARMFYALYFGPEDQGAELCLDEYAKQGHALLVEAVTSANPGASIAAQAQTDLVMGLHGMINIWVIARLKSEEFSLTMETARRIVDQLMDGIAPRKSSEAGKKTIENGSRSIQTRAISNANRMKQARQS